MVIADANVRFPWLPNPKLTYANGNLQSGQVTEWEHDYEFRPGRWAQKDFNFETPAFDLITTEKTVLKLRHAETFERFDYPGRYVDKDLGTRLTRTLMEAEEAAYQAVRGASTYPRLDAGGKFSLLNHPCDEDGKTFVIRRVRHEAADSSYLGNTGTPSRYSNTFEAIPHEVPFRPLRVTGKPFVHGPQTAIVVGPAGEKIFTDKAWPGAGTVSLGSLRQARRQELVLDPRFSVVVRPWLGWREPATCRARGGGILPGRRSRSPADNRASIQWREPHGDGDAGQQDAERDP